MYGRRTTYAYDRNNRLIRTTAPDGYTIAQTYDRRGNVITATDALGNTTHYAYDYLGRLVSVTDALDRATTYTYDLKGNLLSQTDDLGKTTYLEYNCRDLLLRKVSPGGRTGTPGAYIYDPTAVISYTYDALGNTLTRTDRNGNTTVFEWDVHGNLISQAIGSNEISYTYDDNGNVLTTTDPLGTTTRVYDAFNRCVSKSVPVIGTSSYVYDLTAGLPAGHVAETTTDPKGNVTLREYDRAGRLVRVTDTAVDATAHTVLYTYNENGSVASVLYPDGAREDYTYTAGNLLSTLTNTLSDGTVLETYTYTYDLLRNLLTKQDAKGTTSYTYDPLGRVLTVTEPSGKITEYTFDGSGNRATQTVTETIDGGAIRVVRTTYTYDVRNRLTSLQKHDISDALLAPILVESTDYTYDFSGNQLTTTRTTYTDGIAGTPVLIQSNTYDVRNQLIRTVTENGTIVENAYNGDGRRVIKTVNGASTYSLYEYDQVILETNVFGDVTGRNVYGLNLLIRTVGVDTFYYMYNGHADVTALLTPDGTVAASYYYDAFGNILEQTGEVNNSVLFAGYQYDKETGLYYLNARMYDPVTARFLQEDTFAGQREDPLSLNLYTYCHNSPLLYSDPTGHYTEYSYETRGYYNYHGNLLSMDGASDNLAQREMRKAMNAEYPGKPISNPAEAAMVSAGYGGDAFKAPAVVYKTVKVAREVKADNTNSRTVQDYEYQMQMQAGAVAKSDDDSIDNLLSRNNAEVPQSPEMMNALYAWFYETLVSEYGGTIRISGLSTDRDKYPTDAKMLTALSMMTNTGDYTDILSIMNRLDYMLADSDYDGYTIGEKQMEGLWQGGLYKQSCAAERAYVVSSWDRFFSMLGGSGIGILYAFTGKPLYDMAGQIEEEVCGTDKLSRFFDGGYNGLTDWILQGTQQYGVDRRALYDGVWGGEAIGTTVFMMETANALTSRIAGIQNTTIINATSSSSSNVHTDFYVRPNGECIPSAGYRYVSNNAPYVNDLLSTKTIPANPNGTYFSYNRYDIASPGFLQVPHDASIRCSFDTLQIIDDIRIPNGNWGTATYLEPLAVDFPQFGVGGATQAVTNSQIILDEITSLPK